jgi:drug/metabolite transporter (DMT)-like permease
VNSRRLAANAGAFVAAVLFGSSVVAVRVVVQEVPPLSLAVLRFGEAALLLVFVLMIFRGRELLSVKWRDLPLLVLLGIVLFAVFPVTFNASLRLIEVSRGALLLATIPLWSALLARIARSERLSARQVVGVFLSLGGVGLALAERGAGGQGGLGGLAGHALMLVTALCGAAYAVLAQRAFARYDALTVTTYAMVLGTLFLLPAALVEGLVGVLPRLDLRTVALLVFLGVFWRSARLLPVDVRPDPANAHAGGRVHQLEPARGDGAGSGAISGTPHDRLRRRLWRGIGGGLAGQLAETDRRRAPRPQSFREGERPLGPNEPPVGHALSDHLRDAHLAHQNNTGNAGTHSRWLTVTRANVRKHSGQSAAERQGETISMIHSTPENLSAERFAKDLEAHCSGTAERLRFWSCG